MKYIHVAVAVLFDADGKLLIARRPEHLHQGGLLEFPGGKVETGERVEQALVRELGEELGVDVTHSPKHPLICINYSYPDKNVCLDVWVVEGFRGEAQGREGQPLFRMSVNDLTPETFPAANKPIIDALKLPSRCLITGEYTSDDDMGSGLERALGCGIRMVVLRAPALDRSAYVVWVEGITGKWRDQFEFLLVHGESGLSLMKDTDLPVDGCHLTSVQLSALQDRPIPDSKWLGASCHSLAELEKAHVLGCRYGFVSPVLPTLSHPDGELLGWDGLEALTKCATFPVYALGGVDDSNISQAREAGCQGVAGIRAWWDNNLTNV
ncbi:Nudix family hydrolase [Hahella ganghwensis]|uniref:Nudix family hydrolase n=1 Tax=Hahella ganghwensis TaxID=286420 RepID=UPI0003A30D67|nr:Nudix family hydrolase [Hahella ganghwensis]